MIRIYPNAINLRIDVLLKEEVIHYFCEDIREYNEILKNLISGGSKQIRATITALDAAAGK